MAAIIGKAWQGYQFLFDELPDPRTKSWFLIAKPIQGLTLLALYLMFVLKWGPAYMKDRKPYNLDKLLIFYNAFQVFCNAYLFVMSILYGWGWDYKWICEPVDFSYDPKAYKVAVLCNYYFLLKVIDLLDTVFFVLRKKFNQVTFLHVYHHTGMVMLIWGAVTYYPGGHGTFIGVLNSFVHMVMYSYYLLTVAMPSVKNSLWWKKYITQLQILQFLWCVIHMALIIPRPDCGYPRWVSAVFLPQNFFMLILFIDFYIKTYIKKPQQEAAEKLKANKSGEQENSKNQSKNGYKTSKNSRNISINNGDTNEHEKEL